MNDDQAAEAVDPFDSALSLIGNSRETDPPPDEEEEGQTSDEAQEEEDTEAEAAEDPPSEPVKVKIKIKDEDGNETDAEVTHDDLVSGYMRQADYTRKTQALAERERQAVEVVSSELEKGREQYSQALNQAQALIQSVGGLKSASEMAQLAATDPAQWVQESARQEMLRQTLAGIDQESRAIQRQRQEQQEKAHSQMVRASWEQLNERGITAKELRGYYEDAAKAYPFMKQADLEAITDWRAVVMLKDAISYRKLQDSKPAVKAKVAEAAKVPQQRQQEAAQSRAKNEARKQVFKQGGARLKDLAAFINQSRK